MIGRGNSQGYNNSDNTKQKVSVFVHLVLIILKKAFHEFEVGHARDKKSAILGLKGWVQALISPWLIGGALSVQTHRLQPLHTTTTYPSIRGADIGYSRLSMDSLLEGTCYFVLPIY